MPVALRLVTHAVKSCCIYVTVGDPIMFRLAELFVEIGTNGRPLQQGLEMAGQGPRHVVYPCPWGGT